MTKINDIIEKGQSIPDDVLSFTDAHAAAEPHVSWIAVEGGYRMSASGMLAPIRTAADVAQMFPSRWPLTVTAVREPESQQRPACGSCGGTGLVHGGGANGNWTTERCGCAEEPNSEATCHRCGGPNVVWAAPSPLWNVVMRGGSIGGKDKHDGIVCPTCFAVLAEEEDLASRWRLYAESVTPDLESVTPDGRVWDEKAWLWVDPAEQQAEPSVLLDLVRQYGDEREWTGAYTPDVGTLQREKANIAVGKANALFDRIAALVPQQPVQARNSEGTPMWQHACTAISAYPARPTSDLQCSFCPSVASGPWRPLLVGGEPALLEAAHCHHGELIIRLLDITGVDKPVHLAAAVQNLVTAFKTAPQPADPSVLSLPQVPPGTVALIGGKTGARYERHIFNGFVEWKHSAGIVTLGEALDSEGSVTVVTREPRTWPKLDDAPEGLTRVEVRQRHDGMQFVAVRRSDGRWVSVLGHPNPEVAELHETFSWSELLGEGDVTEVFDDEPGGAL